MSKPVQTSSFSFTRPTTAGNPWGIKRRGVVDPARKSKIDDFQKKLGIFSPKNVLSALKEFSDFGKESIQNALYLIGEGLFSTSHDSTSIYPFLVDEKTVPEIIEISFIVLQSILSHGWETCERLIQTDIFKNLFQITTQFFKKPTTSFSSYETFMLRLLSQTFGKVKIKSVACCVQFIENGALSFYLHIIKGFSNDTSTGAIEIMSSLSHTFMWVLQSSFINSEKILSGKYRDIANALGTDIYDILFTYGQKEKTQDTCRRASIILTLLYADLEFPQKFYPAIQHLLDTILSGSEGLRYTAIFSISLLATVPANYAALNSLNVFKPIFDVFVNAKDAEPISVMACGFALCNMVCEESPEARNKLMNVESFKKLYDLFQRISPSSESSKSKRSTAQRNALVIEKGLLIIANMLNQNMSALEPVLQSGLHTEIIEYLSFDKEDDERKTAGNVEKQQLAALQALHSFSFHQTKSIDRLLGINLLPITKDIFSGGTNNNALKDAALSGVLYNIAVTGSNTTSDSSKGVAASNSYLGRFRACQLLQLLFHISQKGETALQRQFGALTLGLLYRNAKLDLAFHPIVKQLEEMKKDEGYADLAFKASNALDMLKEETSNIPLMSKT